MASDFTVERNSSKWVLGADGYLKEYIADAPAIEFNADGSYKGVLVEPASTNECLYSEDVTSTWQGLAITRATDQATSPDGNNGANTITGDGTGTVLRLRQNITVPSAGDYTWSVWAKKSTGCNWVLLRSQNLTSGTTGATYFNLDTGQVGTGSGTIEEYPDGWYRCSTQITVDAVDLTGAFEIYAVPDNGTVTWASNAEANGKQLFIWGAQLEESPIATSYIPTTTGAVTRVKDDIYLTSASSLIGQTEGTLFIEVDWQETLGAFQEILYVSDGTGANRVVIYNNRDVRELRMLATANSVTVTNQGESSTAYAGIQKIAFAYKTDDFELYRNGSSISTDTSGSLASLATLTDVDFGQKFDSANQANMWIRAVALFTTRLSDAECEALTTI